MLWIALAPSGDTAPLSPADSPPSLETAPTQSALQALSWWALQFSPRVCELEQAVLLEVQASMRLFGGSRALLNRVRDECAEQGVTSLSVAPTALAAVCPENPRECADTVRPC